VFGPAVFDQNGNGAFF